MQKQITLIASCLLINIASFAQFAGNFLYSNSNYNGNEKATVQVNTPNGSSITLQAQVMMNIRPTSYTAIFAATQNGRDVMEVDSMMSQRIDQVKYALGLLGIPASDIHVDAVAMVPTYAFKLEEKKFSKRSTEIPVGFEMKKNIHILFRNSDLMDAIISEMAFADIYDLVKVDYNIDGIQTYYEELRKAALSVIQTKEQTYTDVKMHIDVYSMADGFNCTYPMERYKSYTAYNSGSSYQAVSYATESMNNTYIMNGKNNTLHMNGSPTNDAMRQQFVIQTAEKNKTIFYDKMPYNQFDKVMNADTEEPCIQLFYNLQVFYTMITEDAYLKNQEQIALNKKQQEENKLVQGQKHRGWRNR